ncbi:hypothetical protein [Dactylosporangium sp. CS-033363]|uniref:hypothetical protein n=1 Tax=Dactylosporangium sp. CS-033363 TaxID=3239935 RepID=UPI003D8C0125
MTTLYVLDIDDFRPLAVAAAADPAVAVRRRGPYLELTSPGPITVDRAATGCRNAIWYSAVAAVRDGVITQWDGKGMRIEASHGD